MQCIKDIYIVWNYHYHPPSGHYDYYRWWWWWEGGRREGRTELRAPTRWFPPQIAAVAGLHRAEAEREHSVRVFYVCGRKLQSGDGHSNVRWGLLNCETKCLIASPELFLKFCTLCTAPHHSSQLLALIATIMFSFSLNLVTLSHSGFKVFMLQCLFAWHDIASSRFMCIVTYAWIPFIGKEGSYSNAWIEQTLFTHSPVSVWIMWTPVYRYLIIFLFSVLVYI